MIDLYTWTTPNGRKLSIMLEEVGLPYKVITVDLAKGEQFSPEFTAICPNQKIPAIVDHDAPGGKRAMFESGACLIYLAEKTGKLLPKTEPARGEVIQWLMYQMSHVGPIIGQTGHFVNQAPEKIAYAIKRFIDESVRIVGVLDKVLVDREYLAGEYSIADIATYPWVHAAWGPFSAMQPEVVGKITGVKRWLDTMAARPAVAKGMAIPESS
jgi:GST-like protein